MDSVATNQENAVVSRPRRLLKAADIAEWLDVSEWRVYDLVRQDLIPHVKMGRNVRFKAEAIERWIETGGTPLPEAA